MSERVRQEARELSESAMRAAFESGDLEAAAASAVATYGREIYTFMAALSQTDSEADDHFAAFSEAFRRSLPAFRWQSSMRCWLYLLANNTLRRQVSADEQVQDGTPSRPCSPSALYNYIRPGKSYARTDTSDPIRELRKGLDSADQVLLLLRVDRSILFREIGFILRGDVDINPAELVREEVVVRRAFARMKTNFRRMAEEAGLLAPR